MSTARGRRIEVRLSAGRVQLAFYGERGARKHVEPLTAEQARALVVAVEKALGGLDVDWNAARAAMREDRT